MSSAPAKQRGCAVAAVLRGSWRAEPPPCGVSEAQLVDASIPLLRSGGAPLAWWALRRSELGASQAARPFHDTYALAAVQAMLQFDVLIGVLQRLAAAGIDPILGKGWAAAGLYPERGLRPFGDFDFYPRRADVESMQRLLAGSGDVDVHAGLAQLDDRDEAEVYGRSRVVPLGSVSVRLFGAEDHLRLLCLHFLGHGAWRPLWLCDVAAALEARPASFDWDYFLGGARRRSEWCACTLVLAHELLEARLDGVPERVSARRLPRWLRDAALRQWGARAFEAHGRRVPLAQRLQSLPSLLDALRIRWPNAIEASIGMRAPFNHMPRLPIRIAESLRRSLSFAARRWRERLERPAGGSPNSPTQRSSSSRSRRTS
jgi:hypothetical protein